MRRLSGLEPVTEADEETVMEGTIEQGKGGNSNSQENIKWLDVQNAPVLVCPLHFIFYSVYIYYYIWVYILTVKFNNILALITLHNYYVLSNPIFCQTIPKTSIIDV